MIQQVANHDNHKQLLLTEYVFESNVEYKDVLCAMD
jgi:hypothetical protein